MLAFEKYRTATATTSDSSHQLIFIFDEVMKLLHTAKKAMEDGDHEMKFKAISRVVEVFYILKSGVDPETMDESTKAIDTFYGATIARLEQINMSDVGAEEMQPLIDALGEVRSAIIASISDKNEHDEPVNENNS